MEASLAQNKNSVVFEGFLEPTRELYEEADCILRDIELDRVESLAGAVLVAEQFNTDGPMHAVQTRYPVLYETAQLIVKRILEERKDDVTVSKAVATAILALAEEASRVTR